MHGNFSVHIALARLKHCLDIAHHRLHVLTLVEEHTIPVSHLVFPVLLPFREGEFLQELVRRNDKHWCCCLKSYTTFDTDDGIAHVHITTYAVWCSNLFYGLNSLHAILVGSAVDAYQLAILELEYYILFTFFGNLLEVCSLRESLFAIKDLTAADTSICGGEILDSKQGLPETAYLKQVTKEGEEDIVLEFKNGELVGVNGTTYEDGVKAIQAVEEIAAPYGIGRDMHVGDTIIGIKGRVGFEAAAPMLIISAHKFLEKFTLSKWQQYWKDQVANWYGMFLHESQYMEPVMRDIEAMLESSQRNVNGKVTMHLRPYMFETVGVDSKDDLVKTKLGEYGEMQKGWTSEEAKGFIKVLSTPLRVYYANHDNETL